MSLFMDFITEKLLNEDIVLGGKNSTSRNLYNACIVLSVLTIFLFLCGSYVWLTANFALHTALIALSGITFLLALAGFAAIYMIDAQKKKYLETLKQDVLNGLEEFMAIAEDEMSVPVQENPKTAVFLSSLSGFVAGQKIR